MKTHGIASSIIAGVKDGGDGFGNSISRKLTGCLPLGEIALRLSNSIRMDTVRANPIEPLASRTTPAGFFQIHHHP